MPSSLVCLLGVLTRWLVVLALFIGRTLTLIFMKNGRPVGNQAKPSPLHLYTHRLVGFTQPEKAIPGITVNPAIVAHRK